MDYYSAGIIDDGFGYRILFADTNGEVVKHSERYYKLGDCLNNLYNFIEQCHTEFKLDSYDAIKIDVSLIYIKGVF